MSGNNSVFGKFFGSLIYQSGVLPVLWLRCPPWTQSPFPYFFLIQSFRTLSFTLDSPSNPKLEKMVSSSDSQEWRDGRFWSTLLDVSLTQRRTNKIYGHDTIRYFVLDSHWILKEEVWVVSICCFVKVKCWQVWQLQCPPAFGSIEFMNPAPWIGKILQIAEKIQGCDSAKSCGSYSWSAHVILMKRLK